MGTSKSKRYFICNASSLLSSTTTAWWSAAVDNEIYTLHMQLHLLLLMKINATVKSAFVNVAL